MQPIHLTRPANLIVFKFAISYTQGNYIQRIFDLVFFQRITYSYQENTDLYQLR